MKHGGAKLTSKYFITQGEQFALWPSLTERGAEGGVRGMQASKTLHHHTCRALRGGRGVQFILPLVIGIVLLFTVFRENGCCRQQGRCGLTSFIRTEREALRISWVGISEGQRRICGFGGEGGQQHPSIFATWKKLQLASERQDNPGLDQSGKEKKYYIWNASSPIGNFLLKARIKLPSLELNVEYCHLQRILIRIPQSHLGLWALVTDLLHGS